MGVMLYNLKWWKKWEEAQVVIVLRFDKDRVIISQESNNLNSEQSTCEKIFPKGKETPHMRTKTIGDYYAKTTHLNTRKNCVTCSRNWQRISRIKRIR